LPTLRSVGVSVHGQGPLPWFHTLDLVEIALGDAPSPASWHRLPAALVRNVSLVGMPWTSPLAPRGRP
ncbi:MAG: hypothetical protein AAF602_31890, partial [Myxococcota bacterium]